MATYLPPLKMFLCNKYLANGHAIKSGIARAQALRRHL